MTAECTASGNGDVTGPGRHQLLPTRSPDLRLVIHRQLLGSSRAPTSDDGWRIENCDLGAKFLNIIPINQTDSN